MLKKFPKGQPPRRAVDSNTAALLLRQVSDGSPFWKAHYLVKLGHLQPMFNRLVVRPVISILIEGALHLVRLEYIRQAFAAKK